jgi:hypothetical protein
MPLPGSSITNAEGEVFTIPDSGWSTTTVFNSIKMNYQPNGSTTIPEEILITKLAQNKNNRELDYEINQFDLPELRNGAKIIRNFLKYADKTPAGNWTKVDGTVTKDIQVHLIDWLIKLAKRCRAKVSGKFRTDGLDFTPINVLHDPDDNNRLYLPIGVQSNFKLQEYTGELLEVGSGDEVESSAYSKGFKQDAFR